MCAYRKRFYLLFSYPPPSFLHCCLSLLGSPVWLEEEDREASSSSSFLSLQWAFFSGEAQSVFALPPPPSPFLCASDRTGLDLGAPRSHRKKNTREFFPWCCQNPFPHMYSLQHEEKRLLRICTPFFSCLSFLADAIEELCVFLHSSVITFLWLSKLSTILDRLKEKEDLLIPN